MPQDSEREAMRATRDIGIINPLTADGHIRSLADIREEVIVRAVLLSGGSVSRAAKELGIGRSTIYRSLPHLKGGERP